MQTFVQFLDRVIANESISDEEIERLAYPIENFELTLGPNRWDSTADLEQFGRYTEAQATLRGRLRAIETAKKPLVSQEVMDLVAEIADVEAAVQDAEDREDSKKASRLRARARDLKARLAALQAAS